MINIKKITLMVPVFAGLFCCKLSLADQDKFDYYFNQTAKSDISFDEKTLKPSDTLGYAIGDWHIRPDQSFAYFKQLAESSDKAQFEITGYTHEQRPLIATYISSPENLAKLAEYKRQRQDLANYQGPNIVYLGYSVHGNEASGANAAPLVAYRLIASKEAWIEELLKNTIVIIDPMLNPDGLDRFANWVNRYKGSQLVKDPASMELREAWPAGRTNHYWFDLNRDWLLLQHPESQARVNLFYQWRPHIVGDFHEMGTNSTYFFQPGVPSRQNPLTSKENFELTNDIAKYHAKALDALNVPYYSKEGFDDFYYGKGSTFPDINGGIGILFEQASARGHIQESINGDLSFPFAIRNQVATSFSTLKAAKDFKNRLSSYQKDFFQQQKVKAQTDPVKAFIYSSQDQGRLQAFNDLLRQHQIQVLPVEQDATFGKQLFKKNQSYLVSLQQQQYGLIKTLFETRTEFNDNTFYDVSAWTFPLAFNLDYRELNQPQAQSVATSSAMASEAQGQWLSLDGTDDYVAVLVEQSDERAIKNLYPLLRNQLNIKYSTKPFTLGLDDKEKNFAAGTLILSPKGKHKQEFETLINQHLISNGVNVYTSSTGFANQGIDLGSPNVHPLKQPKPLLLIGDGVSSYEAGEAWYLVDKRLKIPLSMQYAKNLASIDLSRYTHLILVNGRYPKLKDEAKAGLKSWIRKGGNLVATRSAVSWLVKQELTSIKLAKPEKAKKLNRDFSQRDDAQAEHFIGGAIYQTLLDNSHPLAYGVATESLAFTKAGTQVIEPVEEDFISVATYSGEPLLAGYSSQQNVERIRNTPAVIAQSLGRGSIILFNDNPNFRGYWYGSSRLFINSLFFNNAF